MKYFVFLFILFMSCSEVFAQEQYSFNDEVLMLNKETDGKLDLLWSLENRNYRYFIKTEDGNILEINGENYKEVLGQLTSDTNLSAEKVKFTRIGLKKFIDAYNKKADINYEETETKRVELRLMPFAGITNNPFITNEDNVLFGQFGAELELRENKTSPRSALFIKARHVLSNDELDFSTTEISLGYRYRFINKDNFSLFADVKFTTLNFSNATIPVPDEEGVVTEQTFKDTAFDVPFIFGIGADYKVASNGYITLNYNEIFAANLKNQGNFSTNLTLGYRFEL